MLFAKSDVNKDCSDSSADTCMPSSSNCCAREVTNPKHLVVVVEPFCSVLNSILLVVKTAERNVIVNGSSASDERPREARATLQGPDDS